MSNLVLLLLLMVVASVTARGDPGEPGPTGPTGNDSLTAQQVMKMLHGDDNNNRDHLLKERVHTIMGRFCGNTDEQLRKWATNPARTEPVTGAAYAEKALIILTHMKVSASGEAGSEKQVEFMRNATLACLNAGFSNGGGGGMRVGGSTKEETDGRMTSLWRLACMVNYRRDKWTGQRVLFDPETEDALDALEQIMQCPQQVVHLAAKQIEHEYLTTSVDRLIKQGLVPHDKKDEFLAKLGPFPDKLAPLPVSRAKVTDAATPTADGIKKDEL